MERVTRVRIQPKASAWVQSRLEAEQLERGVDDEAGTKQITLRVPAEDAAFIDAVAGRFKISRNSAVAILLGSACGDVYESLPFGERKALLATMEKALGCGVKPYWVRPRKDEQEALWEEVHEDDSRTKV